MPLIKLTPADYKNIKTTRQLIIHFYSVDHKIVYLSRRHVSTLLGHHQALQENRSKSCLCYET